MNIKAIFPSGASELIVHGLHQWDYGRKLEIHADDLPALIEVHFACAGMTEAVVRSCAVVQGVAEATIPDQCLEQTTPIVAWVYEVGESSGATIKTITLTVIQRARPQPGGTIPPTISDKYTELAAAVTEQVDALKKGNVTVSKALTAEKATTAETASKATQADKATTADSATKATEADMADEARVASYAGVLVPDNLPDTESSSATSHLSISAPGIYVLDILSGSEDGNCYTAVIIVKDIQEKAFSTIAKDLMRSVSCQVVHYPQGKNESGNYWGMLQVEHDSDYEYNYQISRCVRIANIY
jgi:hypothetical protein